MPRFRVGERVYEMVSLDEMSGRNLLTFAHDATEVMGRPIRFFDVERIAEEIDALPEDQAELHPDLEFLSTVLVWVSRLAAGDALTYGQCLDEPYAYVEEDERPAPKDRMPKKARKSPKSSATGAAASGAEAADAPPAP